jgi:beta-glucosidase
VRPRDSLLRAIMPLTPPPPPPPPPPSPPSPPPSSWACENNATLTADLKTRFGFNGWVMSDWGATHSTIPSALNGLDQQMPDDSYFGAALATAVANGQVPESRIDDMVMRMLTPMYALGVFANNPAQDPTRNLGANATSDAHNALARELAEQSITLLKNTNKLLPANPSTIKSVVILGDDTTVHSAGSGGVSVPYVVTPFMGIYTLLNGPYTPPSRPANCTFYNNTDFYQPSNPCVNAASAQDCCAKCSADFSCNAFAYVDGATCATPPVLRPRGGAKPLASPASAAGGACWKKPDTTGNKTSPGIVGGTCVPIPPPTPPPGAVNVTAYTGQNTTTAAALAAGADLVVVNVATTSSEGSDRADLSLPQWQNDLVYAALAANNNVVVVARCPGACFMPWKADAPAILFQLMPGQESGNALAAAIFGAVNPSGKLPVSFPEDMDQTWLGSPVNPEQFPGVDHGLGFPEATFSEGLFVGYRWYDAHTDLVPLFPFGHGLSYSTFTYSGLQVSGTITPTASVTITFTVTNSAGPAGAEVAQIYIAHPASAEEPPKALKGFQKVLLAPGASAPITVTLAASDVAIFDLASDEFTAVPGTYGLLVGSSSADIRLTGTFTVSAS